MSIKSFMCVGFFAVVLTTAQANNTLIQTYTQLDSLPRVFALGDFDGKPFESLKLSYETTLLSACKNDMEGAYYVWVHMLKNMESFAQKSNFDLSGIKLWLYAFYNKDGSLNHLAFYPKPNSRNIKNEDMAAFLKEFVKSYTCPVKADKNFSNYSNATFPVLVEKPAGSEPKTVNGKGLGNKK
jgi:hypothetical protein